MALQVKRTKSTRTFPPPKAAAAARGRRKHILEKVVAFEKAEKKKLAAAERRRLKKLEKKRTEIIAARRARLKALVLPLIVARDGVVEFGRAIFRAAGTLHRKIREGVTQAVDSSQKAWAGLIAIFAKTVIPALRFIAGIPLTVFALIGLVLLGLLSAFKAILAWLPRLNPLPLIGRAAIYAAEILARLAAWARETFSFLEPRRLVTYSYAVAVGASLVIVGGQIALQVAADARDREATEALAAYHLANNVPAETEAAIAVLAERGLPEKFTPLAKSAGAAHPVPKPALPAKSAPGLNKVEGPVRSAALTPAQAPKPTLAPMPDYYPLKPQRPVIAVVIDDMGMVQGELKRFARLPKEITFAFLPYSPDLAYQTRVMRDNGHELIVHLPMEPKRRTADPGPQALLTKLSDADLDRRIAWNLGRFEGFTGINNHMGSLFTEDRRVMRAVMGALKDRNLYFLDSMTTANSVGIPMAAEAGVPRAQRDIFLDNERDYAAIMRQLKKAERIAERRGHVIAIGHPYRITYRVLRDWAASLPGRNIQLVPLSALISYPLPDLKIAEKPKTTRTPADPSVTPGVTVASSGAAGLH